MTLRVTARYGGAVTEPTGDGVRYEEIRGAIRGGTAARTLPVWAGRVLDDVAGGRSAVPAVRHPLGFVCLPVERSGDLGVCLHIWTPEVRPAPSTTSPVHCHSWDLLSFVLYGTVRNVRMDIDEIRDRPLDDASPETVGQIFEVLSEDGVDELRATGRTVRYSPGPFSTHRTSESYTLPAGVFHTTLIEDGHDAATVALGRHTPGGGDLSLGPLDVPTHRVRRSRSDHADMVRALRRSARRIAAVQAAHGRGTSASGALPDSTKPDPTKPDPMLPDDRSPSDPHARHRRSARR